MPDRGWEGPNKGQIGLEDRSWLGQIGAGKGQIVAMRGQIGTGRDLIGAR